MAPVAREEVVRGTELKDIEFSVALQSQVHSRIVQLMVRAVEVSFGLKTIKLILVVLLKELELLAELYSKAIRSSRTVTL